MPNRFWLLLCSLALLTPAAPAQDKPTKKSHQGKNAITFTVLPAPGVAYQRAVFSRAELRAGADIIFSSAGKTGNGTNLATIVNSPGGNPGTTASSIASDTKNSGGKVSVRVELLYTFYRNGALQAYAGGGALYSYEQLHASNVTTVAEGAKLQVNTTTDEGSVNSVGGVITAGLRLAFTGQFAVYGEWQFRLAYDTYHDKLRFRNESNGISNDNMISADSHGWSNEAEAIKAGLLYRF